MKRVRVRKRSSSDRWQSVHRQGKQPGGPEQFRIFDLAVEPVAPSAWPSVSVCMIVRNEAHNLRPCLNSLRDLASEVIVVDTGSADDTVEIARELGARVYSFPWIDDFAAARNESIRYATGDWIFWLDADDRPSAVAIAQLKRAAASGLADAYMCLVPSTAPDGSEEVTEHIRLFRNGLGIQFECAVHETVFADLVRLGLRLACTDISIEHTGYASPDAKAAKASRNLAILQREVGLHPDRADYIFYRGQARGALKDAEGLAADMREYLSRTRPGPIFDFMRFWAYVSLASWHESRGQREQLEGLLRDALAEFPKHPSFLFRLGVLHAAGGRVDLALREFEIARHSMRGPVRGLRPPEARLEAHLADCCRALGRRSEAIRWAKQAIARDPNSIHAATVLARSYLEDGSLQEAESILGGLLPSRGIAESWMVLAELRLRQGRLEEAERAVQEARGRGLPEAQVEALLARVEAARVPVRVQAEPVPREIGPRERGLSFLGQGRNLEAAECFAQAIESSPSEPDNYRYLAAALQKLGRGDEALDAWRLAEHWQARRSGTLERAPAGL